MTTSETILQCGLCHRQHDGAGGLFDFRPCVPELAACGRADCAAVVEIILQQERQRRERRQPRRHPPSAIRHPPASASPARECRVPHPSDRDLPEASPGLSEAEFVASGKAETADKKLQEFFHSQVRAGKFNMPFSRVYLKELCGNDQVNNRVDKAREVFAPLGVKIENIEYAPTPGQRTSSHYRLVLMTDEEWRKFEVTGKPPC